MSKEKFTPGPWRFDGDYVWADAIEGYVADPWTEDMSSGQQLSISEAQEQVKANGHLIAAATELYRAGQKMAMDYQTSENHHPHHVLVPREAFSELLAALAKARGETE